MYITSSSLYNSAIAYTFIFSAFDIAKQNLGQWLNDIEKDKQTIIKLQ